ncbi:MAG: PadR family transcriptional regulator [Chloroflexi bacterium]|uniref:PadR family transcriptional regulator n=1 Tax=Candidatus Chlorohelix allophototropha TaxID=3003348 RepID=A0A8T7M565_9CHLR|nr:PadR family transcriptional regulator [Chloroflexota bacterium]WJW69178.1 PadR family transcriptional regulator [Chloroflexota bacterium L227-S17]
MDDQSLLLLGILKAQSQHGYQINEFIEKNLSRVTNMKKATAYATLDRLSKAGYVTVTFEQEGNRPQRKVYSITPAGEDYFLEQLRENLSSAEQMTFTGDIGLMFLDNLPRQEVAEHLKRRLAEVEKQIVSFEKAPIHANGHGVNLAVDHVLTLFKSEQKWLLSTIPELESAEQ